MEAVKRWLQQDIPSQYITYAARGVSNIDVEAPIALLSKLLSTEFHVVKHAGASQYMYRAGDYALPAAADAAIATIFGLHGQSFSTRAAPLGRACHAGRSRGVAVLLNADMR